MPAVASEDSKEQAACQAHAQRGDCEDNVMRVHLQSGVSLVLIAAPSPLAQAEVPAETLAIVANQVRIQGNRCEKPNAVERDASLS